MDTNDGQTQRTAFRSFAAAEAVCTDGGNDRIIFINNTSAVVTVTETMVSNKANLHLFSAARDILWKPAAAGGSILTLNGNGCSVNYMLIDGDKGSGTAADYCITLNGKFFLLRGVWAKQAALDCVYVSQGDYGVLDTVEIEKAGRHNIHIEDQQPTAANGSPREITITGRSNIYITDTGSNIKLSGNSNPIGSTTRLIRILSAHIADAGAYGIDADANVSGLVIGDMVTFFNNALGPTNIATTSLKDSRVGETWGRLGLDPDSPLTTNDDNSISFGDVAIGAVNGATSTTQTRT